MSTITGKVAGALMATALLAAGGTASAHHVAPTQHVDQVADGPPTWVVPGLRLTHYSSVATLPDGSYELVEDPNGPLSDPVTGKRYREIYTASAQAASQGGTGSGDGFTELTVAAVEGDQVVVARSLYVNEPLTATRSLSTTAERVAGARVDGAWIRPDLLATMKTGDMGSVLVLRGPVSVAGATYEAVSLLDPTAGRYAFFAYDAASGVLLTSALRISAISGGPVDMSFTELRGTRQLATPGLGAPVPGWLAARPELVYAGTQDYVNPMDPSSAPISSTVSWRTSFPQTGATWAMYETNASVTNTLGMSTPLTSSGVVSGAGPYWWDPAALAGMTGGQTLDADPHTGLTFTVSGVVQGSFGPAVAMGVSMPGLTVEARYDSATGVMIFQQVSIASSGTTTRIQLQQMPAAAMRSDDGVTP